MPDPEMPRAGMVPDSAGSGTIPRTASGQSDNRQEGN